MSGLGGMAPQDQRVAENNALKEWMGENGVWVFDKSDWGVAPHALSVAVSFNPLADRTPDLGGKLLGIGARHPYVDVSVRCSTKRVV